MTDQPVLASDAPAAAPLPPPPPAPPPFELEPEFQGALGRLRAPKRRWWGTGLLLVGSLALFLLFQLGEGSAPRNVALLVGVLLLHESGHWLAMRAFGYRDVRMFFIPFFGAAVSGRGAGVAAWKEGVVALAGPVPGIVLGLALAAAVRTDGPPLVRTAASMLVGINAFNLLPLSALDGGRVLQLAVFQRNRWLEVGFLVAAALGMAAASIWLDAPVLRYVAIFTLVSLPARSRIIKAAHELRGALREVPPDLDRAEAPGGREIFRAAWRLSHDEKRAANPDTLFDELLQLVARAVPSGRQTAALLASWSLGLGASAGALWLLKHPSLDWRAVADPEGLYRLEFPAEPLVQVVPTETQVGTIDVRRLTVTQGDYAFVLVDLPLPEGTEANLEAWWPEVTRSLAESTKGRVVSSQAQPFHGREGMAARLEHAGNAARLAGFLHAGHRYLLMATAPQDDEAVDHFFDSVDLRD